MESKFKYQGPVSSVSLRDGDRLIEVTFFPDQEYILPAENEHIKALVFNKFLVLVEAPKSTRKPKSEDQA